jgi:O-antigen/teichoic acid export membrane protein
MTDEVPQVARNAKWAIAQTIISACVLFALYRFLLQELGAARLGLWSLILASTSLAKLGELGFSSATLRFVGQYAGAGKPQEAAEILETSLLSISVPFLLLAAIAIPLIGMILPLFVPAQHMPDALQIVPWAMLALWLGVTGGLIQSAIDGCGRMDQRNMVQIATNLLYLAGAILLAPTLGLEGVAIAQAIQAGTALLLMWWLARRQLQSLPWLPWRWRRKRFSEIAGFAVTMQAGSVAGMFVEPITKALISRFGGLEFLAFYEMANQVVTRARSVLVSGFQAITPQFAMTNAISAHRTLFLRSQRRVIDIGIPFMTLVMMAFPVLSYLWIGRTEPAFIVSGQILGLTWLLVTLLMPAYFFLTGTGRGLPVATAQIFTLVTSALLGWTGAHLDSQIGPIVGAAISLLLGNIYAYAVATNNLFPQDNRIQMPKWIGTQALVSGCVCLTAIGINLLIARYTASVGAKLASFLLLSTAIALFALSNQRRPIKE